MFGSGLQFSDAYKNRVYVTIGNVDVPFISVDEFRATFRTIPRLREAAASFRSPVLMGEWLGFQ